MSDGSQTTRLRRKSAAEWLALNPTLLRGEMVLENDTLLLKVGDGETQYSGLSYVGGLLSTGLVDPAVLPTEATTEVFEVANQAAMLALSAQGGDMAIRSDNSRVYILGSSPASVLANWKLLPDNSGAVTSVNAKIGVVVLDTGDIASVLNNRYVTDADITKIGNISGANTGDQTNIPGNAATVTTNADLTGPVTSTGNATSIANGAISNAMLANAAVANLSGTNTGDQDLSNLVTNTRTVNGHALSANVTVTASDVGLSNVDNTSDASKPVSTATQTALNLKADIASPTFTGTVSGITAAMVGAPSGSGTSSGANTGDQTNITGNSATATALQTPRTIDGTSFNGSADITVVAPAISAATSKATPVDADKLGLADSAAAFGLKHLTWANLKATLKTYFDTLYAPAVTTYTSSDQTITAAGALVLTHGLSARPNIFAYSLVCQTAELGHSIADVVPLAGFSQGNNQGVGNRPDATNLNLRFGSSASVFSVINATTGSATNITPANWKLRVTAKVSL